MSSIQDFLFLSHKIYILVHFIIKRALYSTASYDRIITVVTGLKNFWKIAFWQRKYIISCPLSFVYGGHQINTKWRKETETRKQSCFRNWSEESSDRAEIYNQLNVVIVLLKFYLAYLITRKQDFSQLCCRCQAASTTAQNS